MGTERSDGEGIPVRLKRPLVPFYHALFLVSAGLAFAGQWFDLSFLVNAGILGIGVMMMVMGVEIIVTRRAEFAIGGWAYSQGREKYRGLAAQLWGVMFLGLGLLIVLVTLGRWIAPATTHSWYSSLLGTKAGAGLAVIGLGIAACLYGCIRLLAGSAELDLGRMTRLSNIVDRVAGAVILLAGLGLLTVGVLLVIAPDVVSAAVKAVFARILQS